MKLIKRAKEKRRIDGSSSAIGSEMIYLYVSMDGQINI